MKIIVKYKSFGDSGQWNGGRAPSPNYQIEYTDGFDLSKNFDEYRIESESRNLDLRAVFLLTKKRLNFYPTSQPLKFKVPLSQSLVNQ